MAEENEDPRRAIPHVIGEALDTLSVREFDERIASLRAEITRLETAKAHKPEALDAAGSIFRTARSDP